MTYGNPTMQAMLYGAKKKRVEKMLERLIEL
jgi:hypothetical protein